MKKNHKSDFDAILRLYTCVADSDERRELGWPDYDWTAKFWTISPVNAYVASCIGGVCTNCFNDNGRIHVVFKNHGLFSGKLHVELKSALLNDIYPDGIQVEVTPSSLGVELVDGRGDCGTIADIEVMLPYIKGDPGADGKDGAQGPQGPQGPPGDNGLSAYEQAVRGGYEGCEEDFMAALAAVDEARKHPPQVFIDMFNARCVVSSTTSAAVIKRNTFGGYDPDNAPDPENPFLLNGLWLSYEEAIEVMRVPDVATGEGNNLSLSYSRARTLFPINNHINGTLGNLCICSHNLEVVRIVDYYIINNGNDPDTSLIYVSNTRCLFQRCEKLREVKGILRLPSNDGMGIHFYDALNNCIALETIWLHSIQLDTNLRHSPNLKLECFAYMIEYAANIKIITITVHADVYAKLTGDTTNAAAAALSPEELAEWQQVCAEANAKNIVFATP